MSKINGEDVRIVDITGYTERTYHYGNGKELTLKNCRELHITRRLDGGTAHRVICREPSSRTQTVYYIPNHWVAVSWPATQGLKPYTA